MAGVMTTPDDTSAGAATPTKPGADKSAATPGEINAFLRKNAATLFTRVPFVQALGLEFIGLDGDRPKARAPWREDVVGDPDTGIIHGGVLTALLDNLCGLSVVIGLNEFRSTATIDLRIDYLRSATPQLDILADAECYRRTRNVAFVRGRAWHETDEPGTDGMKMIATATGVFALNNPSRWSGPLSGSGGAKDGGAKDGKLKDGGAAS